MELKALNTRRTSDNEYNIILREYRLNIPLKMEARFARLINLLNEYLLYNSENTLNEIKNSLKVIYQNGYNEMLGDNITFHKDSLNRIDEDNNFYRLLTSFILMRRTVFSKALSLASEIAMGNIPDYKLQEDFNLAKSLIHYDMFANFYVDLTIYRSESALERFNKECTLMEMIIGYFKTGTISEEILKQLNDYSFEHNQAKMLDYFNKRFVPRVLSKE